MDAQRRIDEILAAKPDNRHGMSISEVCAADGSVLVLSRYGDPVIDLSPYIECPTTSRRINLNRYPPQWRDRVLDVLLAFWRYGSPDGGVPKAETVVSKAMHLVSFIRWLDAEGIQSLSSVRPLHVQRFSAYLRGLDVHSRRNKRLSLQSITQYISSISLMWHLREHLRDAFVVAPFGVHGSAGRIAGISSVEQKQLSTTPLSPEQASNIYMVCIKFLDDGEAALCAAEEMENLREKMGGEDIDRRTFEWFRHSELPHLTGNIRKLAGSLTKAKSACVCLIGLLGGLRIHEILLLDRNCYFESELCGERLNWIRGRTLKTRPKGSDRAEWIVPPIIKRVCEFMERISSLARKYLELEIEKIEASLAIECVESERARLQDRLRLAREQVSRLFLIRHRRGKRARGRMFTMGREGLNWGIRSICKAANVGHFSPHQLRRTFAQMIVHHCGGDLRYLRVQFQHWTIETTALYAQHDQRDQELVDELAAAMREFKVDLISTWLGSEVRLGGPAGDYITEARSKPSFKGTLFESRVALAKSIAPGLVIRPTGHGWCVSTGEPPAAVRGSTMQRCVPTVPVRS